MNRLLIHVNIGEGELMIQETLNTYEPDILSSISSLDLTRSTGFVKHTSSLLKPQDSQLFPFFNAPSREIKKLKMPSIHPTLDRLGLIHQECTLLKKVQQLSLPIKHAGWKSA